MPEAHDDLPLVERDVVRLVVTDLLGRVLLLHIRDLGDPTFGMSWELPGGGIEPAENYADAAVRELREETGIVVTPAEVGSPTWRRDASYRYRGERRWQHERVVAVRLRRVGLVVERSQREAPESEDHFESRWWNVDHIVGSTERFYPRSLPTLLPSFLCGDVIDEPAEFWP